MAEEKKAAPKADGVRPRRSSEISRPRQVHVDLPPMLVKEISDRLKVVKPSPWPRRRR